MRVKLLLVVLCFLGILLFFHQHIFAQQSAGTCQNDPPLVQKIPGYTWVADCTGAKAEAYNGKSNQVDPKNPGEYYCAPRSSPNGDLSVINADCPQNTSDPNIDPVTSNLCYGFQGPNNSVADFRCLQLISDATLSGGPSPTITPTLTPTPTPSASFTPPVPPVNPNCLNQSCSNSLIAHPRVGADTQSVAQGDCQVGQVCQKVSNGCYTCGVAPSQIPSGPVTGKVTSLELNFVPASGMDTSQLNMQSITLYPNGSRTTYAFWLHGPNDLYPLQKLSATTYGATIPIYNADGSPNPDFAGVSQLCQNPTDTIIVGIMLCADDAQTTCTVMPERQTSCGVPTFVGTYDLTSALFAAGQQSAVKTGCVYNQTTGLYTCN